MREDDFLLRLVDRFVELNFDFLLIEGRFTVSMVVVFLGNLGELSSMIDDFGGVEWLTGWEAGLGGKLRGSGLGDCSALVSSAVDEVLVFFSLYRSLEGFEKN